LRLQLKVATRTAFSEAMPVRGAATQTIPIRNKMVKREILLRNPDRRLQRRSTPAVVVIVVTAMSCPHEFGMHCTPAVKLFSQGIVFAIPEPERTRFEDSIELYKIRERF